jgi:Rnl2 family RNA ligase
MDKGKVPDVYISASNGNERNSIDKWLEGNDLVMDYCQEVGIPVLNPLLRGTYLECMAFEVENVVSPTAQANGVTVGVWEGVVIKPVIPKYMPRNNARLIIKKKSTAFSEKTLNKEVGEVVKEPLLSLEDSQNVSMYINNARLSNVFSKLDIKGFQDFGKVAKAFTEDVMEDYEKDFGKIEEADKQKKFNKYISGKASILIREYMKTRY